MVRGEMQDRREKRKEKYVASMTISTDDNGQTALLLAAAGYDLGLRNPATGEYISANAAQTKAWVIGLVKHKVHGYQDYLKSLQANAPFEPT